MTSLRMPSMPSSPFSPIQDDLSKFKPFKPIGDDLKSIGSAVGGKNSWLGKRLTPSQADKGRREAEERARQRQQEAYEYNKGQNVKYDQAEGTYKTARDSYIKPQIDEMNRLRDESSRQANDARVVYEGSIRPGMLEQMDRNAANARSAMSLAEYNDPNNSVARATRDIYDQEALKTHARGVADTGILQAMGAQAAARSFGIGGPMSTGQMTSLYAANQNQAGQAFANTQKQMQSLQDQGLAQGFLQADKVYQAGERAQDRNVTGMKAMSDFEGMNQDRQAGFRDEQARFGNLGAAMGVGMSRDDLDLGYRSLDRQSDLENTRLGVKTQEEINAAKAAAARSPDALLSSLLGTAGAVAGYKYGGGPQGAQAGYTVGSGIGDAAAIQRGRYQEPTGPANPYAVGYR